mmetsp:Transcript_46936/g.111764  ORF Transcript_46936/g.111764 Transcript_46936/m.111764 type:complete len:262 (+) Transcript_46936:778-1563(+)
MVENHVEGLELELLVLPPVCLLVVDRLVHPKVGEEGDVRGRGGHVRRSRVPCHLNDHGAHPATSAEHQHPIAWRDLGDVDGAPCPLSAVCQGRALKVISIGGLRRTHLSVHQHVFSEAPHARLVPSPHHAIPYLERQVFLVLVNLEHGTANVPTRNVRERRQLDGGAAHVAAHSPLVPRRKRHGVDLEEHLALAFREDRPLASVGHLQDVVRLAVAGNLHRLHRGHGCRERDCREKVDCDERERDARARRAEAHAMGRSGW